MSAQCTSYGVAVDEDEDVDGEEELAELEELGEFDEDPGFCRSMRGMGRGVPSNSAHPPRRPISTTRCSIRASSSCLPIHVRT